jgi:tetratricopeptide (TPR) repeat protein
LGYVYLHIGLLDKALEELRMSVALDPNDKAGPPRIARMHWYQGKYEQALAEFEQVPGWESEKATLLCYLGRKDEALKLLQQVSKEGADFHGEARVAGAHAMVLAMFGRKEEAKKNIQLAIDSDERLSHFHHTEYFIACAFALMGEREKALHWLQRTAEDGMPCYPLFKNDPNLINLQEDERFISFMENLRKRWEYFKQTL